METIKLPDFLQLLQPVDFPHKLGVCDRIFRRRLAAHGTCWVRTSAGILWKLDLHSHTHRWIVYGKYEGTGFLNWAKHYLPRDGVVVDSGANIGQMLLYLAQWVPGGRVLAFEPNEQAAAWLEECLAVNATLPVEVIRRGLGAAPARLSLRDTGSEAKHGAQSFVSAEEGTPIEIVRLSDELEARGLRAVDLWKLDVEGYELPALEGARELLARKAVRALYVEMRGDNARLIHDYLGGFGYSCFLLSDGGKPRRPTAPPEDGNGLFLLD